jgi:hypothetical protein
MTPAPATLPREDWIFAKGNECPDDQVELCYLYESAREASRRGVDHDWSKTFSLLRFFPDWRTTPWLTITATKRKQRLKAWQRKCITPLKALGVKSCVASVDALRVECNRLDMREGWGHYLDSITKDYGDFGSRTYFVHCADWRASDKENVRRFRGWLRDNKPKGVQATDDRRRTTTREKLHRLAAMRLVRAFGTGGAKREASKESWHHYSSESAWHTAAQKAEKDYTQFLDRHPDKKSL